MRDRLEILTGKTFYKIVGNLRGLVNKLSLKDSLCYDDDEFIKHHEIEESIQHYLRLILKIHPMYVNKYGNATFFSRRIYEYKIRIKHFFPCF